MTNIVFLMRDRYRLTEQALKSLFYHTDRSQFNLTIVNDGSTDFRTHKILEPFLSKPNVTYLYIRNSGHVLAKLKNLGVYWSSATFGEGEWLYLSDSDVYFKPGWLTRLIQAAEHASEDYVLWGGQIHPFHSPERPHCLSKQCDVDYHKILDGPSWLMRWSSWRDYGPLQPNGAAGPCQSEEYPFCTGIINAGFKIGVIRPHVVIHTGLTQTDGKDAPGRKERKALMEPGVLYL